MCVVPLIFEAGGRPAEETVAFVRSWGAELEDTEAVEDQTGERDHGARAGGWPKGKAKAKAKSKALAKAKTRLRPTGTVVVKVVKPRNKEKRSAGRVVADGRVQVLGDPAEAAQKVEDLVVGARAEATEKAFEALHGGSCLRAVVVYD